MADKRPYADKLSDIQDALYIYIDSLCKSGKLSELEHKKLLDLTTDCVIAAIAFGYSGESA